MKACALAYALVRVIEDHLDAAGSDLNAKDTLQDLARIQCAQLDRAGVAVIKPTTPSGQHQQLLAAISAPIPERNAAAWYKPNRKKRVTEALQHEESSSRVRPNVRRFTGWRYAR